LWRDNSDAFPAAANALDIVGQILDPSGNRIGSEFKVNTFDADSEFEFDAAALPNGGFVVVYTDDPSGAFEDYAIRATEWTTNADGTIGTGTSTTIATSPEAGDFVRYPTVAADSSGGFWVGYERFDASNPFEKYETEAVYVDSSFAVGPRMQPYLPSNTSIGQTDSAVLSDGSFVLVGNGRDTPFLDARTAKLLRRQGR